MADRPDAPEPEVHPDAGATTKRTSVAARSRGFWAVRRWTLRRHIAMVLVGVALVSILIVGVLGYAVARDFLSDEVEDTLGGLQHTRARAIERGLERLRAEVSVLASDPSMVEAMADFDEAYADLDDAMLDAEADSAVSDAYASLATDETLVDALEAAGLDLPPVEEVEPSDPAARYLQYHYLVESFDSDDRSAVVDPGDGSGYSSVHARAHPVLRSTLEASGLGDLMFVSASNGRLIYSVQKSADLGADVVGGVFGESSLGRLISEELLTARTGDAVFIDFAPYLGARGAPVMFVGALVRGTDGVLGALVAEVPIVALNSIMTASEGWGDIGLGETGETYVVGGDLTLRSDSRLWLEDPDAYLEAARDHVTEDELQAIEGTGSTVLVQPVDTAPVRAAFEGERFEGRTSNYLGRDTLSVAARVDIPQLDWVVVADMGVDEASSSLDSFVARVMIVGLVLIPLVAIAGLWLARRVARPIDPLAEAAEAVAAGDLASAVADPSRDEFGHLSSELAAFAQALAEEEAALEREEAEITEMLLAALPARAVEPVRRGEIEASDALDTATVVVIGLSGRLEESDAEAEAVQLAELTERVETAAQAHGLERVHSYSDRHVFVAGVGSEGHHADDAAAFVLEAAELARAFVATEAVELTAHAVLAAGRVAMGVVETDSLSFGVWGRPSREALELDAVAASGDILVHPSAAAELDETWDLQPLDHQLEVGDEAVDALRLVGRVGAASGA